MTLAAIEDSRQRGGTLALDNEQFEKQHTDVALNPSVNGAGDPVETLSGAVLSAPETYSWVLALGYIQDFTDPAGIVMTLRAKAGQEVPFSWTPNGEAGPTFTGTVKMRPASIGGTVATRLTGTVDLPVLTLDD
jgi:hypothetical protein